MGVFNIIFHDFSNNMTNMGVFNISFHDFSNNRTNMGVFNISFHDFSNNITNMGVFNISYHAFSTQSNLAPNRTPLASVCEDKHVKISTHETNQICGADSAILLNLCVICDNEMCM